MAGLKTFNDGEELRKVRTDVINPMVEKLNEQFQDVVASNQGHKCIVDYRRYVISNPSHEAEMTFTVALDPDEYPARAVVHTKAGDTETFIPCDWIHYNRTSQEITVDVDAQGSGSIFVEFWKQL